jgi:hypothetical protein
MTDPIPPRDPPSQASGPRIILPDAEIQKAIDAVESAPASPVVQRPLYGAFCSLALGLAGSAVWATVTLLSGYELGIIAIVIGVLAGVGARKGGPGRRAQWTGALCAALAYFIGQMSLAFAYLATHADQFAATRPAGSAHTRPADDAAAQGEEQAATTSEERSDATAAPPAHAPPSALEVIYSLGVVLAALFAFSVVETFKGMGMVFLGIAVYEGYRIPRA